MYAPRSSHHLVSRPNFPYGAKGREEETIRRESKVTNAIKLFGGEDPARSRRIVSLDAGHESEYRTTNSPSMTTTSPRRNSLLCNVHGHIESDRANGNTNGNSGSMVSRRSSLGSNIGINRRCETPNLSFPQGIDNDSSDMLVKATPSRKLFAPLNKLDEVDWAFSASTHERKSVGDYNSDDTDEKKSKVLNTKKCFSSDKSPIVSSTKASSRAAAYRKSDLPKVIQIFNETSQANVRNEKPIYRDSINDVLIPYHVRRAHSPHEGEGAPTTGAGSRWNNLPEKKKKKTSSTSKSPSTSSGSTNVVPLPGESLEVDPFGSLNVPFDLVYLLGDIINEGAFGVVHKAHHVLMQEPIKYVAVKIVEKRNKRYDDACLHEASILRDIRDLAHVTKIEDFYMDKNNMYIVQELAAGGDVFDRLIERTKYTESDARDLAKILLSTVQSLHQRNLIHRDLKPENLLLKDSKDDTTILLCDFGYTKYLPGGKGETGGLWTRCGTPAFIAPEIVQGVEYGAEVDMWGVGCILFMLLGGDQPFRGYDDRELFDLISRADYSFDDMAWNDVSKEAKTLISSLFTLDSKKRLTAEQALASDWFAVCSEAELQSIDLSASLHGMRYYCEFIRPRLNPIKAEMGDRKKETRNNQKASSAKVGGNKPKSVKEVAVDIGRDSDTASDIDSDIDAQSLELPFCRFDMLRYKECRNRRASIR